MWVSPEEHKVIGGVLAAARRRSGITQVDLAQRLGKPQSFISSYEAGQRRVDVLELLRIAVALDIASVDVFMEIVEAVRLMSERS